jgi:tetratricopeptide (TPR) repeat protein
LTHKRHDRRQAPPSLDVLRQRTERAVAEGRFQQALELARQLYKSGAAAPHRALLEKAYLGRARQLRTQGALRDAVGLMQAALPIFGDDPVWREQVAVELALAGEVRQALELRERQPPDLVAGERILAAAADAAVEKEAAGRELLPDALRPDFDRIRTAFTQLEQGADEALRATLQEIGLRSPYLEWKLLLRGLDAYYDNDDARALDNWQRLSPERLPARLAAPFRQQLDAAYRAAQPPALQATLRAQFERLQGDALGPQFRQLRAALADPESLTDAFRLVKGLLPVLRQQAPQLEGRLARCFLAAVLTTGPDDVVRYERVFGPPKDDPHFHRLRAVAYEQGMDLKRAHDSWQLYEKDLAAHPEIWSAGEAERGRALIWEHLGGNAAMLPSKLDRARLPRRLRDVKLPALKPDAEKCFARALELAPDLHDAHRGLFHWHLHGDRPAKAEAAARKLLERVPDDVEMLTELGELFLRKARYAEALALLQRARKGDPLNRKLRDSVGAAHLWVGRELTEHGRYDEARQNYQAALALRTDASDPTPLLRWAGCEFKAGQAERAEELLGQARQSGRSALELAFQLLVETARLKLDRALKSRFEQEFKEGLKQPPRSADAAALLEFTTALESQGVDYVGRKTHRQKVLTYVNKVRATQWEEEPLRRVCECLLTLRMLPAVRKHAERGERRFPRNPYFPYLDAISYFLDKPNHMPFFKVRWLLEDAERKARAWPTDEQRDRLLEDVRTRMEALNVLDPFGSMGPFSGGFDPFDEYDEANYDDFDYEEDDGP